MEHRGHRSPCGPSFQSFHRPWEGAVSPLEWSISIKQFHSNFLLCASVMTTHRLETHYLRIGSTRAMQLNLYISNAGRQWFTADELSVRSPTYSRSCQWTNRNCPQHLLTRLKPLLPAKIAREHAAKEKGLADVFREDERFQFAYCLRGMDARHALLQDATEDAEKVMMSFRGLQLHAWTLEVVVERCVENGRRCLDEWVGSKGAKKELDKVEKPVLHGFRYGKNVEISGPDGVLE
ncbi:hypothetical protein BC830DRAFT_514694 [Chytriomyces sp. MP71]|nr:hypothetical protein BC830DRAFT_514694 [Chytriomyces sp. MP71]